ncbi:hypothetical protein HYG81_16250 [Natrinema zhouii]|uniref:Uncharacterized protein n=1 Tax=Natrinema zhouii TaxID=1710539 RepID=A0A7D6CP83_9EURY|nr:hypothetical protein [Natrinema zhouii]QLK25614.1 hypothetical protein HYG81_16250 [Natrinema zhouii]
MTSLTIRDHVRPTDGDYPDGIYRVVGTSEGAVTLLRVGDADGRRVNTGEIVTVSVGDLEAFEPAENPDGNRPFGATVASQLEMGYWSLRVFGQQLAAHPFPTAIAGLLVLAGVAGERITLLPEPALTALILAGSLGLAYIGSGRLQR